MRTRQKHDTERCRWVEMDGSVMEKEQFGMYYALGTLGKMREGGREEEEGEEMKGKNGYGKRMEKKKWKRKGRMVIGEGEVTSTG